MAFMLRAFEFLEEKGCIAFLLPASSLTSEKDGAARRWLEERGRFEVFATFDRGAFPGCAASIVAGAFRRMTRVTPPRRNGPSRICKDERIAITLTRGTVQMHRACQLRRGVEPFLIHTTELRDGAVGKGSVGYCGPFRMVAAPAVLLPRVGAFTVSKIALLGGTRNVVPSDCIIALKCGSPGQARRLQEILMRNGTELKKLYRGTGAPYITISRLVLFLRELGVDVAEVGAAGHPQRGTISG